jgi:sugar phosphate isomerase/epimerase
MAVLWGKMATDLEQAGAAAREGFAFLQPAGDLVGSWSDEEFLRQKTLLAERGIACTVSAVPLPAAVRVTQRGFNLYVWMEYLKKALQRLAALGCRRLVWSDGRARVLPVEGELAGLKEQLLQFLYVLCEVAGNHGLTVLVEPLGPRRTNFLNSLKEIGEFLPRVGKENLRAALSLRELEPMGESLAELAGYRELIAHVQLEDPRPAAEARACPRPGDGYDYRPFLQALKAMGYAGGICLPADADAEGLAYCRSLWDR